MIDFQKQFDSVTGALNLFDLSYLISGAAMLGVLSYTYPEFRYFLVHKANMIFSAIICVVAAYISGVICWVIGKRFRYLLLVLRKRNLKVMEKKYIVLEATFRFAKGNEKAIRDKMLDLNMRRKEKQPLEYPSAGSTFKRPEGYFAGKLIMDSGLAGYAVGGACVSTKHCGFVINKNNATANDIRKLMNNIDSIVYEKYGVHLEPEVRMLGEF